jgi:hypothetical protein
MESALYYTLSTVAQTLAGALGMLAAFLAIRVAALDAIARDAIATVQRLPHPAVDMMALPVATDDAIDALEQRLPQEGAGAHRRWVAEAKQARSKRTKILSGARRAFVLSIVAMVGCFCGLAFTPWLRSCSPVAVLALAVAVLLSASCLRRYWFIVRDALE